MCHCLVILNLIVGNQLKCIAVRQLMIETHPCYLHLCFVQLQRIRLVTKSTREHFNRTREYLISRCKIRLLEVRSIRFADVIKCTVLSPAVMAGVTSSHLEQSSPEHAAGSLCRALNFVEGDDINEFESIFT